MCWLQACASAWGALGQKLWVPALIATQGKCRRLGQLVPHPGPSPSDPSSWGGSPCILPSSIPVLGSLMCLSSRLRFLPQKHGFSSPLFFTESSWEQGPAPDLDAMGLGPCSRNITPWSQHSFGFIPHSPPNPIHPSLYLSAHELGRFSDQSSLVLGLVCQTLPLQSASEDFLEPLLCVSSLSWCLGPDGLSSGPGHYYSSDCVHRGHSPAPTRPYTLSIRFCQALQILQCLLIPTTLSLSLGLVNQDLKVTTYLFRLVEELSTNPYKSAKQSVGTVQPHLQLAAL